MKNFILVIIVILTSSFACAQNIVKFEVKDESGAPLVGANVIIEGTTTGTITNSEGISQLDQFA